MSSGAEKDLKSTGVTTFDKWLRFCRQPIAAKVSTIDAQCPAHPQLGQQGSLQAEPSTQWPAAPAHDDPRQHPAVGPLAEESVLETAVGSQRSCRGKWSQCLMAVYSSGFLYFATLYFAWCHFMQGGRDGQIRCPVHRESWEVGEWRSGNRRITLRPCLRRRGKQWLSGLHIFT